MPRLHDPRTATQDATNPKPVGLFVLMTLLIQSECLHESGKGGEQVAFVQQMGSFRHLVSGQPFAFLAFPLVFLIELIVDAAAKQ